MAHPFFHRWSPVVLSILRIVIGLLILEHGTQKILGFPVAPSAGGGGGASHGATPPAWAMMLAPYSGWPELIGGFLLVIGLFTRLSAFILSGEMAIAYFGMHAINGFYPIFNKGEPAVLYCFIFLFLAVAGAGPWSIDTMWKKDAHTANPVTT